MSKKKKKKKISTWCTVEKNSNNINSDGFTDLLNRIF